jgi:(2R)-sulfolactate sulfo-lyase subunit alpha
MANPEAKFLAHRAGDTVAVAVGDVSPGPAAVDFIDGAETRAIDVLSAIPLGHKVALRDVGDGEDVLEYGLRIGIARAPIAEGEYVHTHNVRSARWHNSVA